MKTMKKVCITTNVGLSIEKGACAGVRVRVCVCECACACACASVRGKGMMPQNDLAVRKFLNGWALLVDEKFVF